jgi:hypothetical protein
LRTIDFIIVILLITALRGANSRKRYSELLAGLIQNPDSMVLWEMNVKIITHFIKIR